MNWRIVALDTPEKLKVTYGQRMLRVVLMDGTVHDLALDNPADGQQLSEWVAAGQIVTIHSAEATLEEVFIQLTGRRLVA